MKSRLKQIIMSCNPSQGLNHYYLVIIISNNDTQTENNMSVFYVVFCNIAFHITCEYRKKNEKENYYLTFTQIFWENFRIISASLINVNGKHTPTQLKKNHSATSWLTERALQFQCAQDSPRNAECSPARSQPITGTFVDCPSHLDILIWSTTPCSKYRAG